MEVVLVHTVQDLRILPVPDLHCPFTSRRKMSPTGAEGYSKSGAILAPDVAWTFEQLLLGLQVPDFHCPLRTYRRQVSAVRVERDTDDRVGMRRERLDYMARPAVADPDGAVATCRCESVVDRA